MCYENRTKAQQLLNKNPTKICCAVSSVTSWQEVRWLDAGLWGCCAWSDQVVPVSVEVPSGFLPRSINIQTIQTGSSGLSIGVRVSAKGCVFIFGRGRPRNDLVMCPWRNPAFGLWQVGQDPVSLCNGCARTGYRTGKMTFRGIFSAVNNHLIYLRTMLNIKHSLRLECHDVDTL